MVFVELVVIMTVWERSMGRRTEPKNPRKKDSERSKRMSVETDGL